MADSNEDDIIELTQVAEDGTPEEDQEILELTQMVEDQEEMPEDESVVPGELPGMESDAGPSEQALPDLSGLTVEQLDAAIERVVEKKFSRQIEKILFEVTEKVIKKEIVDIKAGLQRDLDDIDNA